MKEVGNGCVTAPIDVEADVATVTVVATALVVAVASTGLTKLLSEKLLDVVAVDAAADEVAPSFWTPKLKTPVDVAALAESAIDPAEVA